ncbi:MAG: hypothetical protein ACRD3T_21095, partial [Terriglobia bacterium]
DSVAVAGFSQPFDVYWSSAGFNFSATLTQAAGSQNCTQTPASGAAAAVTSISLPNGRSYGFQYDPTYGLLDKIAYPSGGYVRYVWAMTSSSSEYGDWDGPVRNGSSLGACEYFYTTPVITDRYVSFDGSAEVLHQHFAYATNWSGSQIGRWTTKTTTVTAYDLVRGGSFETVYTYSPDGVVPQVNSDESLTAQIPVEQSIDYRDWNGAELRTVKESWLDPRLLGARTTTLENGETSETAWTYNGNEQVTEQDDYDFGPSGSAGPLLRKSVRVNESETPGLGV